MRGIYEEPFFPEIESKKVREFCDRGATEQPFFMEIESKEVRELDGRNSSFLR